MKKVYSIICLTVVVVLYSTGALADRGWGGHGRHHHHGHHRHGYYPRSVVQYYVPYSEVEVYYYPQPPVRYYPVPPRSYVNDQRSGQGLVGGVAGTVFGYEMSGGNPVAAGLGAATGSFIGNEIAGSNHWRRR